MREDRKTIILFEGSNIQAVNDGGNRATGCHCFTDVEVCSSVVATDTRGQCTQGIVVKRNVL